MNTPPSNLVHPVALHVSKGASRHLLSPHTQSLLLSLSPREAEFAKTECVLEHYKKIAHSLYDALEVSLPHICDKPTALAVRNYLERIAPLPPSGISYTNSFSL